MAIRGPDARKAALIAMLLMLSFTALGAQEAALRPNPTIGAYYFDGWAGRSASANDPEQAWAVNAPTHLTKRMVREFPDREPIWGWRDDSLEIMERQIDIAADHGLAFFAFCWYWHDDGKAIDERAIREDSLNKGLELFLKAKNNHRMKFCLLIANHAGFEIKGTERWREAGEYLMPSLSHERYLRVDGKPLIIVFNSEGGDKAGFASMQAAARKAGLPGLAIAGNGSAPLETGFDYRSHYAIAPGWEAGSERKAYSELIAANEKEWRVGLFQPYIPIVTAGWDRRPWEGPEGFYNQKASWYFPDRTPERFAAFLNDAVAWMDKYPSQTTAERIVIVYAWNEFGEGGYIAPTKGDPEGRYLDALKSAAMPAARTGR
jgi:hypothetical protein